MIGDDTPESFYMEGMMAVNNEYESRKTSRNVKGSLRQKASLGGTYGWGFLATFPLSIAAPLGLAALVAAPVLGLVAGAIVAGLAAPYAPLGVTLLLVVALAGDDV